MRPHVMRMLGSFAEFEREMIRERPTSACAKRGPKGAFPAESSKSGIHARLRVASREPRILQFGQTY